MNFSLLKKVTCTALLSATFVSAQNDVKKIPAEVKPVDLAAIAKDKETLSLGYGFNVGKQLMDQADFVNQELFLKGLKAALAGSKSAIPDADFRAAVKRLEPLMQAAFQKKQMEKMAVEKAKNVGHISAFLKETLTKTASGLEYKVIKAGEGAKPVAADTVTVHYTGYLTDGTKFDSSVDRGQPASFPLGGVIKGWTEGLQLMKTGAKYRFKIPGDLAYGPSGSRGIPPNATLVFDVELISIKKAP
jgi:FKBP-type peptidyl-prolyl cis-trans isomerase